jgi:methionine-rich copper-binding protein CopC
MKALRSLLAVALVAGAATAMAHAHLQKSTPSEGSVLTSPPSSVVLSFSEAARVTAAWIQKDEEPKQKLAQLPEKPAAQVTIPVPALAAGRYTVSWRVVGDDGHVVPGQIHFTVQAGTASTSTR